MSPRKLFDLANETAQLGPQEPGGLLQRKAEDGRRWECVSGVRTSLVQGPSDILGYVSLVWVPVLPQSDSPSHEDHRRQISSQLISKGTPPFYFLSFSSLREMSH